MMRNLSFLILFLLILTGQAQTAFLFNYQGVALDASGDLIANQLISIRFDLHKGAASGSIVYTDEQQAGITTDYYGLFNTCIGKAPGLDTVSWQNGPFFLEVSLDISGGKQYKSMGTQQVVSVPFAMMSRAVPVSRTGSVVTIGTKTLGLSPTIIVPEGIITTTNSGNDYTISVQTPTITGTGASTVLGSFPNYTIASPAIANPTLIGSGLATVSSTGANYYNIQVPFFYY